MKNKLKIFTATLIATAIIIGIVFGYSIWSYTFTWNIPETYEIEVYSATYEGGSAPPVKGVLLGNDLISDFADGYYYYWIENIGTTEVKVKITEAWSGNKGDASTTWTYYSGGFGSSLPLEGGTAFTIPHKGWGCLRLQLSGLATIPMGSGNYKFVFTASSVS